MIVTRRRALGVLLSGAGAGFVAARATASETYTSHFDGVMGTSLDLKIRARSDAAARGAEAAVLGEIARQSRILSSYDHTSEFSRWARSSHVPTRVSPELADVLAAFDTWTARTGGAIDASAEVVTRAWQQAALDNRLPDADALLRSVNAVRQRHWIVDRSARTATRTSLTPLALNSFTKSYVIDHAAARAMAIDGVESVIVNAGGDLVVRGDWTETVGVADPFANADNAAPLAHVSVRDRAVATSGGYKRGFDIDGRHYSHIVDPRTGRPAEHVTGATVVSRSAVTAGALATALCVLSPDESTAIARSTRDAEFLMTLADGRHIESAGWRALGTAPRSSAFAAGLVAPLAAADQNTWPAGWQLTITLELARINGGFGRRPYVAVWIEDKDHFPVRTLAVWYDKTRYLPELRAWFRADRLRSMAEGTQIVDTVSSATRAAGKYTLQWDGKDNAGKPVKTGTYTVIIEASREHGSYQLIRQDMEFAGAPKQMTLPGGTEINAASLDYHPNSGR